MRYILYIVLLSNIAVIIKRDNRYVTVILDRQEAYNLLLTTKDDNFKQAIVKSLGLPGDITIPPKEPSMNIYNSPRAVGID